MHNQDAAALTTVGTLRELLPAFHDTTDCSPVLTGELQIKVTLCISHAESEDGTTLAPHCEVFIETAGPQMAAQVKKVNPIVTREGLQGVCPHIRIEDVIEGFQLDLNAPTWELYYE